MSVGELLDYLSTRPRDRLVILAKDAEENEHSPLAAVDEGLYAATSTAAIRIWWSDWRIGRQYRRVVLAELDRQERAESIWKRP